MIQKLRETRTDKGLNQKEVAQRINLTQQTYSDYETGRTNPDIETLIKIADILEVSTDYLLGRSDDFGNITIKEKSSSVLTTEEQKLLNDFRSLPKPERAQATEYVQFLASKRGVKNKQA